MPYSLANFSKKSKLKSLSQKFEIRKNPKNSKLKEKTQCLGGLPLS